MSEETGPTASEDLGDLTLGGYIRVHKRPPAFEGSDGQPYTVSIETERTPDLRAPFLGFLVFPRWAATGLGIVGHVETPALWRGASSDEVVAAVKATPLLEVKQLLDEAIARDPASEDAQDPASRERADAPQDPPASEG